MSGEELDERLYKYPGTDVLRNKLGIRDTVALDYAERRLARQRIEEGCPSGQFDLAHLQAIHRHLFQDIYEWAGEIREVPLRKGDSQFFPPSRIGMAMQDVHKRLVKQNYLHGLDRTAFAKEAGTIIGDINLVHPFREGNGRTQLQCLQQLGVKAGHIIRLSEIDPKQWIEASKHANRATPDYELMRECIGRALEGRVRDQERGR